jgi:hypothetical protein
VTNAATLVVKLAGVAMAAAPWIVPEELWERIEALLPNKQRRLRYPGRKPLPDRQALRSHLPGRSPAATATT